ncbi:MAG: queuosine precursor transporter [Proteobacteria bacterium]|nr:queuosine precursor transporter [Burkholderiales bacterium]
MIGAQALGNPEHDSSRGNRSAPRTYRYYDLVMAGFVCVLLCSNLIGPAKVAQIELPWIGAFAFGAGVLFFPISYVFGDILTEVYGYARARKVVWAGFGALAFASFMAWVVVQLPPASGWPNQAAYETIFGATPRIVAASLIAFWVGEFVNSYVLARMKVWSGGRALWVRMIGSTGLGQGVDTLIFYPVAFYGVWSDALLGAVMFSNYLLKVGWEILALPFTYRIVAWLKRAEQEDHFDRTTDFNPFTLKT